MLVKIHMRISPSSIYQIEEKEFMRESTKGRSKNQRCPVLEAEILKINLKYHFYRVLFTNHKNRKGTTWVSAGDVTSVTHEKELAKKHFKKEKTQINLSKKVLHRFRRNIAFDFREEGL